MTIALIELALAPDAAPFAARFSAAATFWYSAV